MDYFLNLFNRAVCTKKRSLRDRVEWILKVETLDCTYNAALHCWNSIILINMFYVGPHMTLTTTLGFENNAKIYYEIFNI